MKKFCMILIAAALMMGCAGEGKKELPNDVPTVERAAAAAREMVKAKFATDCEFLEDVNGKADADSVVFEVSQSFNSSKNSTDKLRKYNYTATLLIAPGSDATVMSNWTLEKMAIANTETGEETAFSDDNNGIDKRIMEAEFAGIRFEKIEYNGNYMRLATPKPLTRSQLMKVAKDAASLNMPIYFHAEGKTARGEEYAAITGGNLFDYKASDPDKAIIQIK